jgi:two-component system, NarL family, nitrate/nitrite response regulator NarL
MTMPATRVLPQRIRVLLADDHAVFRQGLRRLLETERDFLVVGEASTGQEAITMVSQLRPDILVLDLSMPGLPGLDVLAAIAGGDVPVKAVVLTAEIGREQVVRALQLGARGVLLKSSGADLIFKGLRTIMAGQHWVDRQTVTDLVELVRELSGSPRQSPSNKFGLTPRQLEIVSAVVAGLANRDIARKLSISEDTVKHHLTQIFSKTGVSNRLELALFAMHHQLGRNNNNST